MFELLRNNYYEVKNFFKEKQDCKVFFFRVPSTILFSFLNYDIIQTVSFRIETLKNFKTYNDDIKKAIKLSWLIKESQKNNFKNPLQMLKKGEKYFFHPGTDRILVSLYVNPVEFIEGFYLWYPKIDKEPFIFDYEHYEVKNYLIFLTKFKYSNSFKFKNIKMNCKLDVSDKDSSSNAMFSMAKECFMETSKTFNSLFLSYRDKMQYKKIKKLNVEDCITFYDDKLCNYGGIVFEKRKNLWVVKRD